MQWFFENKMADGRHFQKNVGLPGVFFYLDFFIVAISKFGSRNGVAFNVFVPKTVTSSYDIKNDGHCIGLSRHDP